MKNKKLEILDKKALYEINGGSEESYNIGYEIGTAVRKALTAIGFYRMFR